MTIVQSLPGSPAAIRPRILSEGDCQDIVQRLARVTQGGGYTVATIFSSWTGNVRWARNNVSDGGEVRNAYVKVNRNLNGAINNWVLINDTSDAALVAATRRAERIARLKPEHPQSELLARWTNEPAPEPTLFFEATYNLDAEHRAETAVALVQSAAEAGMLSAGYIEVGAYSMALIDTLGHPVRYATYTTAQVSVTVRDPSGNGSGWAGVDWPDWRRIDGDKLAALALEKCLTSRNPVAVEPGRYTTILEPQAVRDFLGTLLSWDAMMYAGGNGNPLWSHKAGKQVIDPRITIATDPLDPDLGFPAWNPLLGTNVDMGSWFWYEVYHPVTWIKDGIFQQMGWTRWDQDEQHQFQYTGLPQAGGFRMSVTGETTPVEEMIATTKRGILVTRFDLDTLQVVNWSSMVQRGYTRDGVWLIENGKISKPIKNMVATESILFALNNVEQLGVPQRIFNPKLDALNDLPKPVIVPALKIRDFSFTALSEAI